MEELQNLEIRAVDIKQLKAAAYNPRRDLKPGDAEYEKLAASIDRWDLVEPLVWNEETGNLVGGHQRLKICKRRGDKTVQVVVVHLSDTKERLLNLALNKISGSWDYEKLSALLKEYLPEDLGITGLSADEIAGLTGAADAAAQAILSQSTAGKETRPKNDEPTYSEPLTFDVYLSFPTKASAEAWLDEHGYDERFKAGNHTLVLHDTNGGMGGAAR